MTGKPGFRSTKFESLPQGVLQKINKSLKHSSHLELRKATKVWQRLPNGSLSLNAGAAETILSDVEEGKTTLDFREIELNSISSLTKNLLVSIGAQVRRLTFGDQLVIGLLLREIPDEELKNLLDLMPNCTRFESIVMPLRLCRIFGFPVVMAADNDIMTDLIILVDRNRACYKAIRYGIISSQNTLSMIPTLPPISQHLSSFSFTGVKNVEEIPNEDWIKFISGLHKLKALAIYHIDNVCRLFADHLPAVAPLKQVELTGIYPDIIKILFQKWSHSITSYVEKKQLYHIEHLRYPKMLRNLSLRECTIVCIHDLPKTLPVDMKLNLESFSLHTNDVFNERYVIALLLDLPNLRSLELNCSNQGLFTERTLQAIFLHNVKLRNLEVRSGAQLIGLTFGISRLKRLKRLVLDYQIHWSTYDDTLARIFALPELECLELRAPLMQLAKAQLHNVYISTELREYLYNYCITP